MTAALLPRFSRAALRVALLVLAVAGLHLVVMQTAAIELHYEEAQYWLWSRHLDWSYATKGPLVPWLIALATWAFGDGEVQVRLFAWVAHGLFLAAVYGLARDLWGRRDAARWALVLAAVTPVYFLLGGVMTTDVFLFLFWTLGLWAAYRALVRGQRRAWYVMGGAVGVGALGKLSIGLLPAATAVVMLFRPEWRRHYLTLPPWIAAVMVVAIMSPVLGWNAAHDWMMFRHEQGHVLGRGDPGSQLLEFAAGQLLVVSPLLFLTLVFTLWRPNAEPARRLLWLVSLGVLAFFVVKAAASKVQPNWPAAAYIGLLVLVAGVAVHRGARLRTWLAASVVLALVQVAAVLYLPLAGVSDPLEELRGWRRPIEDLARHTGDADFLLTRNYHLASRLAFYFPGELPVYQGGNPDRRFNQLDLWPGPERHVGGTAVYVGRYEVVPAAVAAAFADCTPVPGQGGDAARLHAWRCEGFKGVTWAPPSRY